VAKERGKHDQNFDHLIDKFEDRIYGTVKGEWRLKLLKEDLSILYEKEPMDIWDAGCGLGQMALWFAKKGHRLTCNDISYKMLERTKENFSREACRAVFHKAPAQEVAASLPQQDLVIFHAVIEWLAKPLEGLAIIAERVKPGGYLSLLFFNYHSFVYRNTLRGEWHLPFILDESQWYGKGKKLTPPHPQKPEELTAWLECNGFTVEQQTGMRVFHDYMSEEVVAKSDLEALMALEYKYCREPVYASMGRYVHLLAKKRSSKC
jgi:S-adenosylmethionine-dependent methyltransferase